MYAWVAFPLLRIALLFSVGIVLAVELPLQISQNRILLILIVIFAIYLLFWKKYKQTKFFSLNTVFGLIAHLLIVMSGYAALMFHNDRNNRNHLLYQHNITSYQVRIIDEPEDKKKSVRCLAEVISVRDSIGWKSSVGNIFIYIRKGDEKPGVHYGDIVLISGSPDRTQPPKNPGEFDYQLYLSYKNVFHQDFIRQGEYSVIAQNQGYGFYSLAITSRKYLKEILHKYISHDRERVIAMALLLGTKNELTPEINEAYASAGAMHVLAVSGLHVGIVYGLMLFFFKRSQKGKIMRWVFLLITLSGLWSYALITGLSASVLRAVAMFSLMTIAKVINRNSNIYNTLAAAGLILLCFDPYMIMAVGFQLSFLAVFGIVYMTPKIYGMLSVDQYLLNKAWEVTSVSIAAQIATAPLVLLYFHQFPTYFFLSNLVVIPAAFAILATGIGLFAIAWIPYVNTFVAWILEKLIYLTNEFVFLIERLPNNTIDDLYINTLQSWMIILCIMLFFGWIYYKRSYQLIFITALIAIFVGVQEYRTYSNSQRKEVVFYAIGRHTAIDFIEGNQAILVTDSILTNDESKLRFHIKPKR
jgi:competence protein ComEC